MARGRADLFRVFDSALNLLNDRTSQVVNFFGVGGIGKTWLSTQSAERLRSDAERIPFARFNLEDLRDQTTPHRQILWRLSNDLASNFGAKFPRFHMCLAVVLAREGGATPDLLQLNSTFRDLFDWVTALGGIPLAGLPGLISTAAKKSPKIEKLIRQIGGTAEVIALRRRALQDDPTLEAELLRRFVLDLRESLPQRTDNRCHSAIFLDTYEALWCGRLDGPTAVLRRLETWVRDFAELLTSSGSLLVVTGRERLRWHNGLDDYKWAKRLQVHEVSGLPLSEAQDLLAELDFGSATPTELTPLHSAILECCDCAYDSTQRQCHPLFLSLCADIVAHYRRTRGSDPPPSMFLGIPSNDVAAELADRFLTSLSNRKMELWVEELSLTPQFDETAALALDSERQHGNGRSGWEQLSNFSFTETTEGGFLRLHKTMRDTLRRRTNHSDAIPIHKWFHEYWGKREVAELQAYHFWAADPKATLDIWSGYHAKALHQKRHEDARGMLAWWAGIDLDDVDRHWVGPELWANTHMAIARALHETPHRPSQLTLDLAVEHYNSALTVFDATKYSDDWAGIHTNLGLVYSHMPLGDRQANLNRSIAHHEKALTKFSEERTPSEWALTMTNLGSVYWQIGDDDNVLTAIDCFEAALRVRSKESTPRDWALTLGNLGNAFHRISQGNVSANQERGIECITQALEVLTESDAPQDWAQLKNNLASGYLDRLRGDHEENLKRATEHLRDAMRVFTEEDYPMEWANAQSNLGIVYEQMRGGRTTANLELAIEACHASLRVYTKADSPASWANVQNHLGSAFSNLHSGNRDDNVKRSIEHYEAALTVFDRETFPDEWALVQDNLGNAYSANSTYFDLPQAIACHQQALNLRPRERSPLKWAITQMNLGATYLQLPETDSDNHLTDAIICLQSALEVFREEEASVQQAMASILLGNAFSKLPNAREGKDRGKAIAYYKLALKCCSPSASPKYWAMAQKQLSKVYAAIDTVSSRALVVKCHEAVLGELTRDADPITWALCHSDIAQYYYDLGVGSAVESFDRAIYHFECALLVFTKSDFPDRWTNIQNALGIANAKRDSGNHTTNLRNAIEHFEAALNLCGEEEEPLQWAMTHFNMASAYLECPTGDVASDLQNSVNHYEASLRVYNVNDYPSEWTAASNNLAQLKIWTAMLGGRGATRQTLKSNVDPRAVLAHYEGMINMPNLPVPILAMALTGRGTAHAQLGQRDQAIADFSRAIDMPVSEDCTANAFAARGSLYFLEGQIDEAIEDLSRVVEGAIAPIEVLAQAQYTRAEAFRESGEYAEAIEDYTSSLEISAELPQLRATTHLRRGLMYERLGTVEQAISDYSAAAAIPQIGEIRSDALTSRAVVHAHLGDTELAIADFTEAIGDSAATSEVLAKAHTGRGEQYAATNRPELAVRDFDRALELHDKGPLDRASLLLLRGKSKQDANDERGAIADFTATLKEELSAEQISYARFCRGCCYSNQSEVQQAVEDFSHVIESDNESNDRLLLARFNRAVCCSERDTKYEEALSDYSVVIESPDFPSASKIDALFNRGLTHERLGSTSLAFADYNRIIDSTAVPPDRIGLARVNRAVLHANQGNGEVAVEDYTAVIHLDGALRESRSRAFFGRGLCYGRGGRWKDAVSDLTRALESQDAPDDVRRDTPFHLGIALSEMGSHAEAVTHLTNYGPFGKKCNIVN